MKTCNTRFHGQVTFRPQDVLDVPRGLFGFEDETEFLLLEVPTSKPVVFIQSVRSPELCFISLPAQVVDPKYILSLNIEDLGALGYSGARPPRLGVDALCLVLLTIRGREVTTANLQAPLVVDIHGHHGLQVFVGEHYSHQHALQIADGQLTC